VSRQIRSETCTDIRHAMLPAAALALALAIFYPVFAVAQPRRKHPVDKANDPLHSPA